MSMMAKVLSLVLSASILAQSLDITVNDITKLDELLEHASFHSEKYGDNLMVFLSKHYGELKNQHHEDHQEEKKDHEELPFQNHCHCSSFSALANTSSYRDLNPMQPHEYSATHFNYQPSTSSPHTEGLLQPPQVV